MADELSALLRHLSPVRRGMKIEDVVTRDRIQSIQDCILSLAQGQNLKQGANIRKKQGPNWVMLSADPKGAGAAGAAGVHHPWEITVKNEGTEEEPDWRAEVRPGTVNSLVPANIFGSFPIPSEGTYFVKLKCDTDGKTPNGIDVVVDTSPTDPVIMVAENLTPPTFYDVLGIVGAALVSGSLSLEVFQIRSSNLSATPLIAFLEPRTPIAPGDEPFVRWWRWNLTIAF